MTGLRITLVAACAVLGACAAPSYGVRLRVDARRELSAENRAVTPQARDAVSRATTIAFYPPSTCAEQKAGGAGAVELDPVLKLHCGVVMTDLENAATRAGFSVVSWQVLRGPQRPIEYARENGVDLLFEINDLSVDRPGQQTSTFTNAAFFERRGDREVPIFVEDPAAIAKRCADRHVQETAATDAVSIDVKMVSVADGRVRWAYRDTKRERPDERTEITHTYDAVSNRRRGGYYTFGIIAAVVGALVTVTGVQFASSNVVQSTELAPLLIIPGALAVLGGAALIVAGSTPRWGSPEETLCVIPEAEEATPADATAPPQPENASQFSLVATQNVSGDVDAERRNRLLRKMIVDFMATLNGMRTPASAPPPAAPGPTIDSNDPYR